MEIGAIPVGGCAKHRKMCEYRSCIIIPTMVENAIDLEPPRRIHGEYEVFNHEIWGYMICHISYFQTNPVLVDTFMRNEVSVCSLLFHNMSTQWSNCGLWFPKLAISVA